MNRQPQALIEQLVDAALALGHWETLRATDQSTIDYWQERVDELSRALSQLLAGEAA